MPLDWDFHLNPQQQVIVNPQQQVMVMAAVDILYYGCTTQQLDCNSPIFEGTSGSIYSYSTEDSLISLIEINLRLILIDEFS